MSSISFFFFHYAASTDIYTLSLHDALPIREGQVARGRQERGAGPDAGEEGPRLLRRSEEHTSELQSRQYLVCRLLLEKKKHCMDLVVMTCIKSCYPFRDYLLLM